MKRIAFFDFDGTVTTHDSFRELLVFLFGKKRFYLAVLFHLPWILAFGVGLLKNDQLKQKFVAWFFTDFSVEEFEEKAKSFVKQRLNRIIRSNALKRMLWHLQQGDRVVLVSASFEDYLKFWCNQHEIELIGTVLEKHKGRFTGAFATPNCWGPQKVERIKELVNLDDYEPVYAYGDTRGDREMLAIADEPGFRVF